MKTPAEESEDLRLIASLRRELEEVRRECRDYADENVRMRTALRWYLDDDRRRVDEGALESVGARPAFAALGGRATPCLVHPIPTTKCSSCYRSPARPKVTPAPPRARESRP